MRAWRLPEELLEELAARRQDQLVHGEEFAAAGQGDIAVQVLRERGG